MPWIQAVAPPPGIGARAQPRQNHQWYKIRNVADDEAEVLVYDDIGGYWGTLAEDFVRELREITARKLTVRINSPGGSFFDGVTIANALRAHPARVTTRVEGLCASAASVIAMAGDHVVMMPQTQLMIHDAIGGCYGNAKDMQEMVDILDRISDSIADAYAAKAGGTREEWRQRTRDETWYSPEEAVAAGLVDEATPMTRRENEPAGPAEPEMRNTWDLSVFRYAGREQAPAPQSVAAKPTPKLFASGGVVEAGKSPVVGEGALCDGVLPLRDAALCTSIGAAIGEEVAAALRAVVASAAEPAAPPVVAEPESEETPEPADAGEPAEPATEEPETPSPEPAAAEPAPQLPDTADEPPAEAATSPAEPGTGPEHDPEPEQQPETDQWAAAVAHLTQPTGADNWAALTRHLTQPSSAATTA